MRTLLLAGLSGAAMIASVPASAAADSMTSQIDPSAKSQFETSFQGARGQKRVNYGMRRGHWGPKVNGRWHGGVRAPNGYRGYRKPFAGFRLPHYWVSPSFAIPNYRIYNLRQPTSGYNWTRYYDDAVLTDNSGRVYDSVHDVNWDSDVDSRSADYDEGVLLSDDRVYAGTGGGREAGSYNGEWNGRYVDDQGRRYEGEWNGTYRGEDGRIYEGNYRGAYEGEARYGREVAGADYRRTPTRAKKHKKRRHRRQAAPRYSERGGYGLPIECRKSSGIGGAIAGGVIGGIAGSAIAKRGDRTGGTLIGAGLGALAGGALEQASAKCRKYLKRQRNDNRYPDNRIGRRSFSDRCSQIKYQLSTGRYPELEEFEGTGGPNYRGRRGWELAEQHRRERYHRLVQQYYRHCGGSTPTYGWTGYHYGAPQVTTITIQPATSTTTTTTYVEEDVVYVKPKRKRVYRTKRKWQPRKGCQC